MSTIKTDTAKDEQNVTDEMLDAFFSQALLRHQEEDWEAAESFYRKILTAIPDQPNANFNLGMLKLQCNQVNESLSFFKTALLADAEEPKYWTSYVEALLQAGQKKLAVETLVKGLERGIHGDEVDALIELLEKPLKKKAAAVPVTIANYANQANILAVTQRKPQLPIEAKKESKREKSHTKQNGLQRYLDNPKIQKVLKLQESGKLAQAQKKWLSLLKFYPNHPIIFTCLGSIALQQNHIEESIQWLEKSIAVEPEQSTALSYLSIAFLEQKKYKEAITAIDKAIAINPNYAEAYVNKGNALRELKRFEEAITCYEQSLSLKPDVIDSKYNLGLTYADLKQFKQAAHYLHDVVSLTSKDENCLCLYGEVLLNLKKYQEALVYLNTAIDINATNVKAKFARGVVYMKLKQFNLALEDLKYVVKERPNFEKAYNNLGLTLREVGQHEEALIAYDKAIKLDSAAGRTLNNKGLLLVDMQRYDEALDYYNQALRINPNNSDSHWNKALLYLLTGDFKQGWPLYEYRWKSVAKENFRRFTQPLWLGKESITGKTILIYPEQGFGDYIQFCRYITKVEKLGAKVVLEAPRPLLPLIKTLEGNFTLVEAGSSLPEFDYHCPIMSLPLAFNTALETIPENTPYLYADDHKVASWAKRIGNKTKPRIGLVWSGSVEHNHDHHRSIPLETLRPLFTLPYEFHALQNQIRADDLSVLQEINLIQTHKEEIKDFADTAALIEEMDLVITVDTSVAHLAGAMGKDCWVLIANSSDFRWLLNRADSPWYPSITLFKQPQFNDWDNVIKTVRENLEQFFK